MKIISNVTANVVLAASLASVATVGLPAAAQGPGSLPFANTYRRPAVSRYQNMGNFANNPLASSNVYQSIVQPNQQMDRGLMEQMSQNQRLGQLQSDVQGLERRQSGRLMDATIRPTGHSATYLNYSHFYPGAR